MFRAALDVRGTHKAWGRRHEDVEGAWDHLPQGPGARARGRHRDQPRGARRGRRRGRSPGDDDAQGARRARRGDRPRPGPAGRLGVAGGHQARSSAHLRASSATGAAPGTTDYAQRFRSAQDLPAVLGTVGRHWLPADHVHVVTGAPTARTRGCCGQRFGEVVGFDPARLPRGRAGRTPTTRWASTEIDLLRRVNVALDEPAARSRSTGCSSSSSTPSSSSPYGRRRGRRPPRDVRRPGCRGRAVGQGDRPGRLHGARRPRRPGAGAPGAGAATPGRRRPRGTGGRRRRGRRRAAPRACAAAARRSPAEDAKRRSWKKRPRSWPAGSPPRPDRYRSPDGRSVPAGDRGLASDHVPQGAGGQPRRDRRSARSAPPTSSARRPSPSSRYEDRDSEHRLKADEAYEIGERGHPVRAYLDAEEIVAAAARGRRRRDLPRLRLPLGEPRAGRGLRQRRHHLHRPDRRGARR